jgi:prepilin-type processing-associated H-X9-DG protein
MFCPNLWPLPPLSASATTSYKTENNYRFRYGFVNYSLNPLLGGGTTSNNWIRDNQEDGVLNRWIKMTQIRRPAETIFVSEAAHVVSGMADNPTSAIAELQSSAGKTGYVPYPWHGTGCNVLWVDGHVTTARTANADQPWTILNSLGKIYTTGVDPNVHCYWLIK